MTEFTIRDSGERQEFAGGMMRDTTEGKTNFLSVRFGPMLRRWADHLTKGRVKYPDPELGVPNWTLAEGKEEALRAKESAARHFEQWLDGDRDEDHAAGVFFNINLFEYVLVKAGARGEYIDPAIGAGVDVTPKTDLGGDEKPWTILPAEERKGKWEGVFGFSQKVPTDPPTMDEWRKDGLRPTYDPPATVGRLGQGDLVRDAYEGPWARQGTGVVTEVSRFSNYPYTVSWPDGIRSTHRRAELVLVESACNGNCLGCDC